MAATLLRLTTPCRLRRRRHLEAITCTSKCRAVTSASARRVERWMHIAVCQATSAARSTER
eukprot:761304-Pyramimonas_sp.AAC.1